MVSFPKDVCGNVYSLTYTKDCVQLKEAMPRYRREYKLNNEILVTAYACDNENTQKANKYLLNLI